jgi:hypothetical protein
MCELAVKTGRESVQQPIGCIKRHDIISTNAMRIHNIIQREDISWGAYYHSCLQAGFITILHNIESGIGRANYNNSLEGEVQCLNKATTRMCRGQIAKS